MLKPTDQAATVLVIIRAQQADIHTPVAISTSYNQPLTLGSPVKLACFTLIPAAHHCLDCLASEAACAQLYYK